MKKANTIYSYPSEFMEQLTIINSIYNQRPIEPFTPTENLLNLVSKETQLQLERNNSAIEEINLFLQDIKKDFKDILNHPYAEILFTNLDSEISLALIFYYYEESTDTAKEESVYFFVQQHLSNRDLSFASKEEFTKTVFELDTTDSIKYQLIQIIYSFDDFYQYIHQLIEIINPKYQLLLTKYQPMIDKFMIDLNNEINQQKLTFFKEFAKSSYIVYPSIINAHSLVGRIVPFSDSIVYSFGIFILTGLRLKEVRLEEENSILSLFKALSDKTKYTILTLLKTKDYYSQELAKELSLTGATISHHMNQLLELNLVTFTTEKKRVYYHLNTEEIEKVIIILNQNFLN